MTKIAERLNEEGHRTKQGKLFSKVQVKRILDRRHFYSGKYQYGDIIANAKRAPLHPYKGKLNPFYPMDETTRGAFQKVDSINYWKIRGEEALGGRAYCLRD